ncbi:MAG: lysophospholipid acyltransferase family protein, partial [Alphaproteobacteria bacterium]
FNIALFGSTALVCFLLIWTLPLPRHHMLKIVHLWLHQIEWIERHIGGITYRVIGREHIPSGSCIIAAKHQSAWETFKLHFLFGDPAIVLKKELLNIPVWGWYLRRSGMIPIDRKGRAKALSGMMQAAHRAVADGRKIVIFPQGTRIPPGEDKPYKSGVIAFYQELKLPLVPMALNSGLLWPKNSFIKKPGVITIEFLPPLPPGLPRGEVMEQLRNALENTSNRLAGISHAP